MATRVIDVRPVDDPSTVAEIKADLGEHRLLPPAKHAEIYGRLQADSKECLLRCPAVKRFGSEWRATPSDVIENAGEYLEVTEDIYRLLLTNHAELTAEDARQQLVVQAQSGFGSRRRSELTSPHVKKQKLSGGDQSWAQSIKVAKGICAQCTSDKPNELRVDMRDLKKETLATKDTAKVKELRDKLSSYKGLLSRASIHDGEVPEVMRKCGVEFVIVGTSFEVVDLHRARKKKEVNDSGAHTRIQMAKQNALSSSAPVPARWSVMYSEVFLNLIRFDDVSYDIAYLAERQDYKGVLALWEESTIRLISPLGATLSGDHPWQDANVLRRIIGISVFQAAILAEDGASLADHFAEMAEPFVPELQDSFMDAGDVDLDDSAFMAALLEDVEMLNASPSKKAQRLAQRVSVPRI